MKNSVFKTQIADEKARRKIVEDLDRTILVEAGAGSGKTRSLVDRMLSLLRSGVSTVDKMAAVTFTRKAAAELRGRFQTSLERSVRKETGRDVLCRLQKALSNLEQGYIGTIHSFCAKILRERPVEADLDPEFAELDDIENEVFLDACWHEYLFKVRIEDNPLLYKLSDLGLAPEDLKSAFFDLANYPEVHPVRGSAALPDFSRIKKELNDFLDSAAKRLPSVPPGKGYDSLQKNLIRCLIRRRTFGHQDSVILMDTVELLDGNLSVTYNRWPDKKEAESVQLEWKRFNTKIVKPALQQWREFRHTFVLDFLQPALDYFHSRLRQASKVNYHGSLLMTARLLKEYPRARQFFQQKYTHILVDEFQDTDPIQAEMLFYLAGEGEIQADWWRMTLRPGSLFLVGDPKQSIYRFRRADMAVYNTVKKRIRDGGGDILHLTSNFRSVNELGDWNNRVFHDIFPVRSNDYQAAFAPMITRRDRSGKTFSGIYKMTIPKVKRDKKEKIAEQDASRIAGWIQWACRGNAELSRTQEEIMRGAGPAAQPEDFMILVRYKENMSLYARALEERGLLFEINGGGAFQEAPELNELLILVRALLDPNEAVSTVAALRGLFFGCSDRELLDFKKAGGDFCEWKPASESSGPVDQALFTMGRWREWFFEDNPSTALERICEESGFAAYLASSPMGSSRAGNVYKLLDILRHRENKEMMTFGDTAEFLEELFTLRDIEEMSLTPGRSGVVRIMNLHKAKGLEAPVVFLANPLGVKPFSPDRHIVRRGLQKPQGYFVVSRKGNYHSRILSQPAGWEEKEEDEKRYQQAEEERLMYVASTRAKNALIISTYEEDKKERMSWTELNKHVNELSELPVPEPGGRREKAKLKISGKELREWQEKKEEEKNRLISPRYQLETVTSLAETEEEAPPRERGDGGMSWGRVVHYVLEVLGRMDVPGREILYRSALDMEERDPEEIPFLRRMIEDIERSGLWKRALRAEQKYFEIPFSVSAAGEELERDENDPVILTGTIDLVFKEAGGWVIADYKTDEIFGSIKRYLDYYAPQIQLYRRFWEKVTGEKVKECGLYFTSIHRWVILDV